MSIVPLPGLIGQLFAIERGEWIAVNDRVSVVIEAAPIRQVISQSIPNFDALLSVCQDWSQSTYAALIGQAALVSVFATDAAQTLAQLQTELAGLAPTDPVPEPAAFTIKVRYASLADVAADHLAKAEALAPVVAEFTAQNRAADAAIQKIGQGLGPGWQTLEGPIDEIESGMSDLDGGWANLVDVLEATSAKALDITTAELLAADLAAAVARWDELAQAAVDFDEMASSLKTVRAL
ncbi:MAG TPA: hypothetical protein VK446_15095 [Methylocystis sp.]|nr:hypothetical protein [Methylocystis sp.]